MSIAKIEQEIEGMKKELSEISPGKAIKAEPVQEKKGSSSVIIWVAVLVIIIALVVLALFIL
jgi:hypothetical protein